MPSREKARSLVFWLLPSSFYHRGFLPVGFTFVNLDDCVKLNNILLNEQMVIVLISINNQNFSLTHVKTDILS